MKKISLLSAIIIISIQISPIWATNSNKKPPHKKTRLEHTQQDTCAGDDDSNTSSIKSPSNHSLSKSSTKVKFQSSSNQTEEQVRLNATFPLGSPRKNLVCPPIQTSRQKVLQHYHNQLVSMKEELGQALAILETSRTPERMVFLDRLYEELTPLTLKGISEKTLRLIAIHFTEPFEAVMLIIKSRCEEIEITKQLNDFIINKLGPEQNSKSQQVKSFLPQVASPRHPYRGQLFHTKTELRNILDRLDTKRPKSELQHLEDLYGSFTQLILCDENKLRPIMHHIADLFESLKQTIDFSSLDEEVAKTSLAIAVLAGRKPSLAPLSLKDDKEQDNQ